MCACQAVPLQKRDVHSISVSLPPQYHKSNLLFFPGGVSLGSLYDDVYEAIKMATMLPDQHVYLYVSSHYSFLGSQLVP